MKKLSVILASLVLFAGVSFASPQQDNSKTTTTKKTEKTTKKTNKTTKKGTKGTKKADQTAK